MLSPTPQSRFLAIFIYVIGVRDGPVKVGISAGPWGRLMALQTGCPFKLELLHMRECRSREHALWHETNFHEVYEDRKLLGEWFDVDATLAIEGVDTAFEIEDFFEKEAQRFDVVRLLRLQ